MPARRTCKKKTRKSVKARNGDGANSPTVAQVLKMQKTLFYVLNRGGPERATLTARKCVFVHHLEDEEEEEEEINPDDRWIFRIVSVHKNSIGGHWLYGTWFYTPTQAEKAGLERNEILSIMGHTELFESDHADVINVKSVEGRRLQNKSLQEIGTIDSNSRLAARPGLKTSLVVAPAQGHTIL
ncbi:hypothetical protein B0H34DRAFT_793381 [Crassisporium funariophilum]|nr:hypothetical protein B0H34DRAFT_793381 [Crassisporium funariophilum]